MPVKTKQRQQKHVKKKFKRNAIYKSIKMHQTHGINLMKKV